MTVPGIATAAADGPVLGLDRLDAYRVAVDSRRSRRGCA
jgi:hypothetical protein